MCLCFLCVCAAVLGLAVIKDIHQNMTVVPGSVASWDPGHDLGNHGNSNQTHTDDVPQEDSSCFLLCCDSFSNYEWRVMRQ